MTHLFILMKVEVGFLHGAGEDLLEAAKHPGLVCQENKKFDLSTMVL